MPDNQLEFHSAYGKRRILIVEDELINQEMLKIILDDVYDIISAETGAEALARLAEGSETISLVLLDLNLPDMHGLDVLKQMKADSRSARIPVIVMTAEKDAEVESLTLGAIDFIPKPYPQPKVIHARVLRTIELCEDRDIIRSTERDHLTGLYNREYFYRYAAQYDVYHKDQPTDAIVLDINHFHIINERYGKNYADEILKRIGEKLMEAVGASGGIVCRREADTFLAYCPHRGDYAEILENASVTLRGDGRNENRVRLRMGVYSNVDKTIDIERRFDRAKLAADTVKNSFTKAIGIYDDSLHESEIFAEQLLDGFETAVREKQFEVVYQPKFNIRPQVPVLTSAEALVRWKHPQLGTVSPAVFIPLFEQNGLIRQLDDYIWREAAARMKDWKDRGVDLVPVSVNVSRIDLYDPFFVERMQEIMESNGLSPAEFYLEVTESAYTENSDQIIRTVKQLREKGFRIEMDDFGSGYSSLNMISTLPIDALKLDMEFIRNAFRERKDTRLLEVVIQLAESLEVPTIAEGVETAEQMLTLKTMGCDIVQGYYFSQPLSAGEFETFMKENKEREAESQKKSGGKGPGRLRDKFTYDALHDPLTGLYNHTAFDILFHDADKDHIAVMIAEINDYALLKKEKGRKYADEAVLRVADVLRKSFRSVDDICRLKEDEFVVIMTRVSGAMHSLIYDKVAQMNQVLQETDGVLQPVSLSVGVAFSDREKPEGDVFQDADTALLRTRQTHPGGCTVF